MSLPRSGEIAKYPVFSLLIRVFPDENNKNLDIMPSYKAGLYYNEGFKLYENELILMQEFANKKNVHVSEILKVIYSDLSKTNEEIIKASNNGRNHQKLLEFIDQNYFESVPAEYMMDDLDTYQTQMTEGFYLSVDAIYESREDGRSVFK